MKNLKNQLKVTGLCSVMFFMSSINIAQNSTEYLDINNIKTPINSDGTFNTKMEVPKNSGINATWVSSLWVGGIDEGNELRVAAQTYKQGGSSELWPGPLRPVDATAGDSAYWSKVWKVNKSVIEDHKLNWNNSSYAIPGEISQWPGNGPSGFAKVLAPYIDYNKNGVYDPENGDYPHIQGDQAIYFIFNDSYKKHLFPASQNLGIEVHGMAYAYKTRAGTTFDQTLENTIFVNWSIINRSKEKYTDVYAGVWNDFDLGCAFDDLYGTDSVRNMTYVYNGDLLDEDCRGTKGYGKTPPAVGCVVLSENLGSSLFYKNSGTASGNPSDKFHNYNYLKGNWGDSSSMTYGGDGYKSGGVNTKFIFSGEVCDDSGWNSTVPNDGRSLSSIGPFNLEPGEAHVLDVAYVYARSSDSSEQSVCSLFDAVDYVKKFYDDEKLKNPWSPTSIKNGNHNQSDVLVFPNPMEDQLTIKFAKQHIASFDIKLYDARGRMVLAENNISDQEYTLERGDIENGLYFLTIRSNEESYRRKILVK